MTEGTRVVVKDAEFYNGSTGTITGPTVPGSKFDFIVELDDRDYPLGFSRRELTSLPNQ